MVCGEGGTHNKTPHPVLPAWLRDVMAVLKGLNIGYAVWNFRGSFGVMDSRRADSGMRTSTGPSSTGRCSPRSSSTESGEDEGALDISSAHPDDCPLISDNGPFDSLPEYD